MLSNAALAALIILIALVTFELVAFIGVIIMISYIAKEISRKS